MHAAGGSEFDVVVVGGGPAGISAGVTLSRARRSVLVADDGTPRNAPAEGVHNYLGREGTPPGELLVAGRAELSSYGGMLHPSRVVAARRAEGGFELGLADGQEVVARRVIVATGLADELPEVTGLAERWGRDVLHCPYCHGYEVRDRRIGVLASGPTWPHQVQLLRQWSQDVVLLAHTGAAPTEQQCAELTARSIKVVTGEVVAVESSHDRLSGVRLADGSTVALDALAVAPRFIARGEVPAMLGLDVVEQTMDDTVIGTAVPADVHGRTTVPGLWVAGNVADLRAVVISAAAAGTAVATAVNADLVEEDVHAAVTAHRAGRAHGQQHDQQHDHGHDEPAEIVDGVAFWEGFYSDREQVWSGQPNSRLVEVVEDFAPGSALDLGAGEGGDAVWLAARGWSVTAVDVVPAALERLAARAADEHLAIRTARHDLTEDFPVGAYDLVSAQYLHSPVGDFPRGAVLRAAAAAVAPGGLLLVVGHGKLGPWTQDPTLTMPTAEDVVAELALAPEDWTLERVDSPERETTGPDGQTAVITDEIVTARRSASRPQ